MKETSIETPRETSVEELCSRLCGKKVFLFDFDGVLANSLADIAASANAALAHFGFPPLDTEAVRAFVGDGARSLVLKVFSAAAKRAGKPLLFSDSDIDQWLLQYREHYKAHPAENTCLYPGIGELLQSIKEAGARAAVVTNKPSELSAAIAERLGILQYFDAVIGPEDAGGNTKPSPAGLAEALRRINARLPVGGQKYSARDVLMTGDSPQDLLAGKRFGCETCAVLKGFTEPEKLFATGADFYVSLAGDLGKVFARAQNT